MTTSLKQRKFKPRIKLKHNIYMEVRNTFLQFTCRNQKFKLQENQMIHSISFGQLHKRWAVIWWMHFSHSFNILSWLVWLCFIVGQSSTTFLFLIIMHKIVSQMVFEKWMVSITCLWEGTWLIKIVSSYYWQYFNIFISGTLWLFFLLLFVFLVIIFFHPIHLLYFQLPKVRFLWSYKEEFKF